MKAKWTFFGVGKRNVVDSIFCSTVVSRQIILKKTDHYKRFLHLLLKWMICSLPHTCWIEQATEHGGVHSCILATIRTQAVFDCHFWFSNHWPLPRGTYATTPFWLLSVWRRLSNRFRLVWKLFITTPHGVVTIPLHTSLLAKTATAELRHWKLQQHLWSTRHWTSTLDDVSN